jgi:hypothetical protein
MLAGRDVPGIRYGAYFCPGATVDVPDPDGTFRGQITGMGWYTGSIYTIAVTDPGDNPQRHVGERVERVWTELRLVTQ